MTLVLLAKQRGLYSNNEDYYGLILSVIFQTLGVTSSDCETEEKILLVGVTLTVGVAPKD